MARQGARTKTRSGHRVKPATNAREWQACTDVAELSVIIILALGALATAGWTVARLARLVPAETEDHRLKRALQSAADGLAKRQLKLVGGALVLETAISVGLLAWLHGGLSWWMPFGLAVGAACSLLLAHLSVGLSLSAVSSASRLVSSGDSALVLGLRTGSALMLVSGAVTTLLGVGALVGVRMGEAAASIAFLHGCLIGGLSAGLMLHMTGSSLRVAGITSRASGTGASKQPFYCLDSNNPSLILDLVAQHTGAAQGHVLRVSWAMSLQHVLVLLIAGNNPIYGNALLGTVLLTHSAALVCAGLIHLVLRGSDGVRTWASVLNHGLLANAVLTLVALTGASYWLLGENAKVELLLCALLGAALTWITVSSSARGAARQNRRLEDHQDNQRRPALDVGFAVPSALQNAALQLASLCLALMVAAYLADGSASNAAPSPTMSTLLWLTIGAFVALPYVEAQALLEPLTEATSSLAALRMDQGRGEPHAQLSSLCSVGQQAGAASQRWFSIGSGLLALLGLSCLTATPRLPLSPIAHAAQALLALAVVLGALGAVLRRVAVTALAGVNEVARHHRAEDSSSKPGYVHYVETVTGRALERALWTGASLVLAVWFAVAAIAKIPGFATGEGPATPTTFLAFVAAAGISLSLLGVGIASFVGVTRGFRRVAAESTSTPLSDSLNTAQLGLAEMAGSSLAPAALILVHLTIAVVLVVAPFVQ